MLRMITIDKADSKGTRLLMNEYLMFLTRFIKKEKL